eukprot:364260-Chlamydomonas_euryale.AAC.9
MLTSWGTAQWRPRAPPLAPDSWGVVKVLGSGARKLNYLRLIHRGGGGGGVEGVRSRKAGGGGRGSAGVDNGLVRRPGSCV